MTSDYYFTQVQGLYQKWSDNANQYESSGNYTVQPNTLQPYIVPQTVPQYQDQKQWEQLWQQQQQQQIGQWPWQEIQQQPHFDEMWKKVEEGAKAIEPTPVPDLTRFTSEQLAAWAKKLVLKSAGLEPEDKPKGKAVPDPIEPTRRQMRRRDVGV